MSKIIKPEDIAKAGTEHAHQAALFCWVAQNISQYPQLEWLHAIPNGGLRDKITAGKLKSEGVKAGVADINLPLFKWCSDKSQLLNYKSGLYIEMKIKPNKPTKEQLEFAEHVRKQHFMWVCCYSWIEAKEVLINYLNGIW